MTSPRLPFFITSREHSLSLRATLRRLGRQTRDFSLRYIQPVAPGVHYFLFFRLRRFLLRRNTVLQQLAQAGIGEG